MKLNKTYFGDCLEIMPDIPDKSVDMILCDLPYGTTQNKWDSVIDLPLLWVQYKRVIKDNGAIVLTASQPFASVLVASNLQQYKYEWVWVKNLKTGFLNARKMPMGGHETVQVFCRKSPTYNPQKRKRTTEVKSGNRFYGKTSNYGAQKKDKVDNQNDLISPDTALIGINCVHNSSSEKLAHPTQKPVALFEYLIKTYTNPGELVLDNCAGSGTTGEACFNTGRNYIQIEKDKDYYEGILCREMDLMLGL